MAGQVFQAAPRGHTMLTKSELLFLKTQGLAADDVFDAQGRPIKDIRGEAKALGKMLVVGVPCGSGGHRLRTRHGHCVQCKPATLGYLKRASAFGDVYIAVSPSLKWTKVGSTTNREQRFAKLNFDAYGNASDWRPVFWITAEQSGRVELDTHRKLSRYSVEATYIKDGKPQVSRECFTCPAIVALNAIVQIIQREGYKTSRHWRDERYRWK